MHLCLPRGPHCPCFIASESCYKIDRRCSRMDFAFWNIYKWQLGCRVHRLNAHLGPNHLQTRVITIEQNSKSKWPLNKRLSVRFEIDIRDTHQSEVTIQTKSQCPPPPWTPNRTKIWTSKNVYQHLFHSSTVCNYSRMLEIHMCKVKMGKGRAASIKALLCQSNLFGHTVI